MLDHLEDFRELVKSKRILNDKIIDEYLNKIRILENICETGPSAFYLFNPNKFDFEYMSPGYEKLTGYKITEIGHGHLLPFFSIIDKSDVKVLVNEVTKDIGKLRKKYTSDELLRQSYQFSYRIRKKNKKIIRTLLQYHVLELDESNKPLLVFGRNTEIHSQSGVNYVTAAVHMYENSEFELIFQRVYPSGKLVLTKREKEVLKLIVNGLTNRDIADKLFISVNTVKRHRQNILEKLEIETTNELIKFAVLNGIY